MAMYHSYVSWAMYHMHNMYYKKR